MRAVVDTADVSARMAHDRPVSTVDRRPEWSGGVDIAPVVGICFLRCACCTMSGAVCAMLCCSSCLSVRTCSIMDAFVDPQAHLLPTPPPGAQAALDALTTCQDVALLAAWAAIYLRWCAVL